MEEKKRRVRKPKQEGTEEIYPSEASISVRLIELQKLSHRLICDILFDIEFDPMLAKSLADTKVIDRLGYIVDKFQELKTKLESIR
jgi:hypothetical protein